MFTTVHCNVYLVYGLSMYYTSNFIACLKFHIMKVKKQKNHTKMKEGLWVVTEAGFHLWIVSVREVMREFLHWLKIGNAAKVLYIPRGL